MVVIAVVLVGLFATTSMRGQEKRGAKRRDETRTTETPQTSVLSVIATIAQGQDPQRIDPDR